ncbi:MAG TPA: MFS transporter [Inquilinus sp.]
MAVIAAVDRIARSRIRYQILLMLFAVTVLNYADCAIISVAGAPLSEEFGIDPVAMGYIFSAFSWSYVAAQIPGGWLLDRHETKRVTPIIIGYILHATGSFNGALVFVGLNAFVAMAAYLFVVGEIRRVELER